MQVIFLNQFNTLKNSEGRLRPFQTNTYTTLSQENPSVTSLNSGGFVVVWDSLGQDADSRGIYGRVLNNPPILIRNSLTVNEGQTVILSTANLNATDSDHNDTDLIFILSNVQYGQFERVSNAGVAIMSFKQQEIIDEAIQFVHDGSENQPMYDVSVSDSIFTDGPTTANIIFSNNVNDPPSLENNAFSINKGETVILSTLDLSATDSDHNDSDLTFITSNVQYGQFERVSNAGVAIRSFKQQEIIDGAIQFVHDGSENQPMYDVSVSDGLETLPSEQATIVYIAQNQLVVKPGEALILKSKQLDIQTQLAPGELEISLSNVQYGRFEKNIAPGISITSFILTELDSISIQFIHSGTEHVPQFTLHFKDLSANYTFPRAVVGNAILNHLPIVRNPTGTLNWLLHKESTYPLPNTLFSEPDGQQLQLSVRELNDNPLPAWVQFDNATNILTGTPRTAGLYDFKIIARDPYDEIAIDRFAIDIKTNNGTTIIGEGTNPVPIVAAIASGAALISSCVAAGIVYFKKAQDRKTRQQHEFARKIRHHLKLQKIDNFKSEEGQRFIQAVQVFSNELLEAQGIDVANMSENRLDELARNTATAAKNKINPATVGLWKKSAITIQEFADNIHEIAKDNSLSGLGRHGDDVNIPMHTIDNTADNNFGTLVEEGVDAVRQIFSPKAEFV